MVQTLMSMYIFLLIQTLNHINKNTFISHVFICSSSSVFKQYTIKGTLQKVYQYQSYIVQSWFSPPDPGAAL